ncbi:DedA family protein [Snodgrassella sp. CFCC 13594]|uniref:DedA family protein n=1 Tax=Snodgrassella sp. CFCC 13594 TaxID=1775559 RepID=UPI00082A03C0|nr:DedA family protein [Snodgrassella sp. CFCC 13594]
MITALIDFILHIDQHLQELAGQYGVWIYAILFFIIFCETGLVVTPFLPGDSLLFAAGGIAAIGKMDIHLMVALLLIAAILGDAANFAIGKYFGAKLFANPHSKIFKQSYLQKTEAFYAKHGGKTIIIARFVPIVRTFAPFVAGMGHMHYGHFLKYNIIGAIAWVLLFSYAGYFFGQLPVVKENLSLVLAAIIVISLLPAVIEIVRHKIAAKRV